MAEACYHMYSNKITKTDYSFCSKCGCLVLINNKMKINAMKPYDKKFVVEFDPIDGLNRIKAFVHSFVESKDSPLSSGYAMVRKQIIQILKRAVKTYKFSNEIFILSLSYVDNILKFKPNCHTTCGSKLELIAVCCFLLAVKFAANDPFVPDYFYIENSNYDYFNLTDVRLFEDFCLKALNYKLDIYTAHDVLSFFINHGVIFEDEISSTCESFSSEAEEDQSLSKTEKILEHAQKLLNNFLLSNRSLQYNSLQIALSVVYLTREFFELDPDRTDQLLFKIYKFDEDYFSECMKAVREEENKRVNSNMLHLNHNLNFNQSNINRLSSPSETIYEKVKTKSHTTKLLVDMNKHMQVSQVKTVENKTKMNPKMTPVVIKSSDSKHVLNFRNSVYQFPKDMTKEAAAKRKPLKSINFVKLGNGVNGSMRSSIDASASAKGNSNTSLTKTKFNDLKLYTNQTNSSNQVKISFPSSGKLPFIVNTNLSSGMSFYMNKKKNIK